MKINFLGASLPLTKTITPTGKDDYPLVGAFTSYSETVTTTKELYAAIQTHADMGHCLLKGNLSRPLTNESRRGTTNTDEQTEYLCYDWDRHECPDLDAELARMGLGDISYVLQYSASHGLPHTMGTVSAHVFMLLSAPLPAPVLKAHLMEMNLTLFSNGLRLSRNKSLISWPLDITTCQNDKLLYIAPPVFKGMSDPLNTRISLVKRQLDAIPVTRIGETHIATLKSTATKLLNELRKAEGMPARTGRTTWQGSVEILNKPDVCTVTGIKDNGEFVRLNLNGGDSWAYWYGKNNFELVHDFKSDTWFRMKELIPGYYANLVSEQQALTSTPTDNGDLILAFRDLKTDCYYNGIWNPAANHLSIHQARDTTRLDHWLLSHGRFPGEFVPIWDIQYNPRADWTVDEDNHRINTFRPSSYMQLEPRTNNEFPAIKGIITHMLGCMSASDNALYDHFINFLACIMQRKHKPLTAWVGHGCEGTGKGYLVKKIIVPLLGVDNCQTVLVGDIEDQFNGWLEGKLFVFVDEVSVDDFTEKGRVTSKLRNYITEPTISLRKMRQQTVDVPNHVSFLFSSNRPQPVFIPESDRRYNVGNFQHRKLERPDDDMIESELEAFAQFLLAHKADIKAANSIIQTPARALIQKLGITSVVETCRMVQNGDFESLWLARPDERLLIETGIASKHADNARAYCILLKDIAAQLMTDKHAWSQYPISREDLQIILQYNVGSMPETPNKFTSLLRHNGIETTQVRKNGRKTYGIKVNWVISDELREELLDTLKSSSSRAKLMKRVK